MTCETCGQYIARGRKCSKCYSRKWRKEHPMRASYNTLKYNAHRRGVYFDLTFEQFSEFATECRLMTKRGITAESFTVDRIDASLGYTYGNLQVLTNRQNGEKGYLEKIYRYIEGLGLRIHTPPNLLIEDSPF